MSSSAAPLGAVPMLASSAARWSRSPLAQSVAALVRRMPPEERARVVLEWVQDRVTFTPDPHEWTEGDTYQSAAETWARRSGDCDDAAPLLAALLSAAGLRARLVAMASPALGTLAPRHVGVQVLLPCCCGWAWTWAEPTVRGARLGERPEHAAARVRAARSDLR